MKTNLNIRKATATLFSCLAFAIYSGLVSVWDGGNSGLSIILFTILSVLYSAPVIIIYGNTVSYLLEYVFRKKKNETINIFFYITLHIVFGACYGLFINIVELIFVGAIIALIYAVVDVWIARKQHQNKSIRLLTKKTISSILPISCFLTIFWIIFNPYTEEEAIKDLVSLPKYHEFPKTEGTIVETENDYTVKRSIKGYKKSNQTFIIRLEESWKKGNEEGHWFNEYEVTMESARTIQGDSYEYFLKPYKNQSL